MIIRRWRFALIVWMILIFVASSSLFSFDSTKQVLVYDPLNLVVRKSAHMTEYAILVYLWFRSLWTAPRRFSMCTLWSVALAILYAAPDEWHQSFVPERQGVWTDVIWDGTGAVIMGFVLWAVRHRGMSNMQRRFLGQPAAIADRGIESKGEGEKSETG